MRLYRSAPGSHPAPVPRCCGRCTVEGRAALPCRHVRVGYASCSGQTAQSSFRKAAGNRLGAGTGRRKRDKGSGQPFRLPGHDGQPPGTANSLDKSCAMVCHKSRKFLFFWAGACGRRRHPSWAKGGTGAFPHSGKNPMGWFGERRKKVVERGEVGLSRRDGTGIRRQAGMSHRAVAQKASVFPGVTPEYHAGRGNLRPCAHHQRSTASRHIPGRRITACLQRFRTVPSFAEKFVLIKRAGRGREFEGGGTFSRWQKVPPPSRKQPFLLRAGGIRASGH